MAADQGGLGEFERIAAYFAPLARDVPEALGLKDDAALLDVPAGQSVAISTDALVEGVHYLPDDPADLVARKALRVNLSDMAAMGAAPIGYTVALALSKRLAAAAAEQWLAGFARGLEADQRSFGARLFGGDSVGTPGPTTITVTVFGLVGRGRAMRRAGAAAGDDLWVSGTIGDAAAGLDALQGRLDGLAPADHAMLADRYRLPRPRIALGLGLAGLASAGLDVSDGLIQDLGHVLEASGVAAVVERDAIPLSGALAPAVARDGSLWRRVLGGGDDYELLFTARAGDRTKVEAAARAADTPVSRIGRIEAGRGVRVVDGSGQSVPVPVAGWRHA